MSAKQSKSKKLIYWAGYEICVSLAEAEGKPLAYAACPKCGLTLVESEACGKESEIIHRASMRVMIHMKLVHNIPPDDDPSSLPPAQWIKTFSENSPTHALW